MILVNREYAREKARITIPFNREWAFCYDPGPEPDPARAVKKNSSVDFTAVSLPHTWQTYETTGRVHPFVRDPAENDNPYWWQGWGWYRKVFRPAAILVGRRVFLELDGAQKFSRVYCNGELKGEHAGGFSSFSVELTDAIRWDGENVVAVAVSARQKDVFGDIPPRSAGNWALYGGLYREARLVLTGPVHIPFQGSADHEGGLRITTPEVSRETARVRVETCLRNAGEIETRVVIRHALISPEGKRLADFESEAAIAPGEIKVFTGESPVVLNPRLWEPENPFCYRVKTLVLEKGELLDEWESPLGFRWFRWDKEENALYLNDRRIMISGMNRHQEYPWLGDAIPWWIQEQDLRDIRYNLGVNFARWCHYPQDRRVYDWCDRHGIIVCEEVPNIKNQPFGREHQRRQVLEMIRRDRNHPCIIMWSMGNETDNGADGRWARAEDPTRLVHYRKVTSTNYEADHTHEQLDMENLLRCTVRGWWEQGAMDGDVAALPGNPADGQVTGTEAWQHEAAKKHDGSVRGSIDDDNTVAWIYADHGADREYRNCPLKHVNPKGWVDVYRQPKEIYWLWQANRTEKLMVHVRPYWWRPARVGEKHDIVVDSNGESVELLVGGRRVGTGYPKRKNFCSVVFKGVPVENADLLVRARRGEETVEERLSMPGSPAALRLTSSHGTLVANRADIALVSLEVVDEEGKTVTGARPDLRWDIEGPGTLVGPPDWRSEINRREATEGTMYIVTPVVMPVRAGSVPGRLRIRASSPGLAESIVFITVESPAGNNGTGIIEMQAGADGTRLRRQAEKARLMEKTLSKTCPVVYVDQEFPFPGEKVIREEVWRMLEEIAGTRAARSLAARLSDIAVRNRGVLLADDINFHLREWFIEDSG